MHPALIKAELEIAGYYQVDIARELRVTLTSVGDVISGKSRSQKIEARIAAAVGKAPSEIWPQWYDKHGKPVRRRRAPARTADAAARLAAKAAAVAGGR